MTTTARAREPRGLGTRASILTRLFRSLLIGLAKFKIFDVTVFNRSAVPAEGRVIIACNHISWADPVFLWGALRRNAIAMAMAELWKYPGIASLMRSLGHIPVERGNKMSGVTALKTSKEVLEHEGAVIIFPEGKCATGDTLLPMKVGVAVLSLETGAPVLPTGVKGTNEVKPLRSRKINRRAHVDVRFGTMIYPQDFVDRDNPVADMMSAIEASISELSGRARATEQ